MQLLVDVSGEAHLLHALDVTGPRAEADPVQHVRHGPRVGVPRNADATSARPGGRGNAEHQREQLPSSDGEKAEFDEQVSYN